MAEISYQMSEDTVFQTQINISWIEVEPTRQSEHEYYISFSTSKTPIDGYRIIPIAIKPISKDTISFVFTSFTYRHDVSIYIKIDCFELVPEQHKIIFQGGHLH